MLPRDSAPIHKSTITHAAVQYTSFTEVNHPAYSLDIALSDYHLFLNLKNFLRSKNFENDDEAIITVNHYLESLDSDFFSGGMES